MTNKREQIIQSAIVRIAEQGGTFTTDQVAYDAGCSQSLVFRHFGSKEGLMEECFKRVCQEIIDILHFVELPDQLTKDSLNRYAMDIWNSLYRYLRSNSHIAKTYLFFITRWTRFPSGYRTPREVMQHILGDNHSKVISVYPEFDFMAVYLMVVANVAAAGPFQDWIIDNDDPLGKLDQILKCGICGNLGCP